MPNFLFLYRGDNKPMEEYSPEEMQAIMQTWMEWMQGGTEAGWLVEGGDALHPVGKVVQPDLKVVDGPFAEAKELVGGYSIVKTETLEAACEIAKTCPIPASGGTVEVRQMADVGSAPEEAWPRQLIS